MITKFALRLDEQHRYWQQDSRIPGFSEIAQSYFGTNNFWTDQGRAEGTHLHQCCALLVEGDLDWSTVHADVLPRVKGFAKFLADTGFRPALEYVERPQFEPISRYACTPDWPGFLGNWTVVIEGKRGAKSPVHRLQTAAQKLALAANGFTAQKRFGLYLRDNDYRLEEHADREDESRWRVLVAAYHAKTFYDHE